MHIYIYIYTHIHVYIYIYIYTYIHTYIHAYIHTYIHTHAHIRIHIMDLHMLEMRLCTRHTPVTPLEWRDGGRYGKVMYESAGEKATSNKTMALATDQPRPARVGFEFQRRD